MTDATVGGGGERVDVPGRRPPLWRRALRWSWLLLTLAALAWGLSREWEEVRRAATELPAWRLVASVGAAVVGVGMSGQVWRALVRGLGAPLGVAAGAQVFFVGQLGKYLPGSVWPVLAQMELGRDHGVAPRTSAAAVVLFLWVHLCTGALVACAVLPTVGAVPGWVALGAPVALLLVAPGVLGRALTFGLRLVRREPLPRLPTAPAVATALAWAALMWGCYGIHLWILLTGVPMGEPGGTVLWSSTGTFAAAWTLGFLLLVAPAGAGAREGVLIALLPVGAGAGLLVAVASRVAMTVADLLWSGVGLLARRRHLSPR